jgi:hypothetical protein
MHKPKITNTVEKILSLLVDKNYSQLGAMTQGQQFLPEDIKGAIDDYGYTIIHPPKLLEVLDVIQVKDKVPATYSVRVDLWTKEEGRSDLSLELTLIDIEESDLCTVEIDDLHVL